ncbi:AraC family transcriptional regulator [Pseudonocardia sp. CA-107938]|uniref:helix-turn-helix transcriptional regulator n=1 Tax=Pseudonocardia sp. CA-107938 TaxID=3240021 RepID=UPI003D91A42A
MTRVESMTFAFQHAHVLRALATAVEFDPHLHSTYSVVVVTNGSADIRSGRWSRTVHAGEVFFFNPFEVHAGSGAGGSARYHVLYPSDAFLDSCLGASPPGEDRTVRTDVLPRSRTARELVDALSAPVVEHASVEEALRRVVQECTFAVEPVAATPASVAQAVCRRLRRGGTGSTRTADLARELGVHPSHLVRSFTTAIGIPPQTYVRQLRVARARELICAGFALDDVAQMANFSDQPHLTREFKKVFGVPPGALSRSVPAR